MFYRSIDNFRVIPKSVFAELPQKHELSKEQKQFYEDNGFLVVKKLIDFASLYSYRRRFQQICNGLVPSSTHMTVQKDKLLMEKGKKMEEYVVKIQDLFYDEVFSGYFESPVLLDVVSQFLGDDIVGVNSMLVNKPPGTGRHPTHQDMYYFPFRPADKIIATWTAVDDVTVDNGCLFVLPGSHKVGRIYEHGYTDNILKMYHGILDEEAAAPESARVDLEMSPGDTAFFHPLLLHGSRNNSTKNYRKAISGHFAAASCHYVDVTGTPQEAIAREIVAETARRGMEGFTIQKIWEVRSKLVKGVRSHL